jgi:hypothetical protein
MPTLTPREHVRVHILCERAGLYHCFRRAVNETTDAQGQSMPAHYDGWTLTPAGGLVYANGEPIPSVRSLWHSLHVDPDTIPPAPWAQPLIEASDVQRKLDYLRLCTEARDYLAQLVREAVAQAASVMTVPNRPDVLAAAQAPRLRLPDTTT